MWATFWSYDRHRGWTALEKDCIVYKQATIGWNVHIDTKKSA